MGIIQKVRDFFFRMDNICAGCGVALIGLQSDSCSEECELQARAC
jgi:hypothetical protein